MPRYTSKQPQQQHIRKPPRAVKDDNFHAKKHHREKHHPLDEGDEKSVSMVDPAHNGRPSLASDIASESSIRPALLTCVAGQRGGANTPVLGWKLSNYHFPTPAIASIRPERDLISARKLAATLWELYGTPLYQVYLHHDLNKDFHSGYFKKRNELATTPFRTTQQYPGMHDKVIKSEIRPSNVSPSGRKSRTRGHSLISNELVKLLNQIWALEEQYHLNVSMVAKLQADLQKAKTREEELKMVQKSLAADIERLKKMLVDERAKSCECEQQNVKEAIKLLKEQLEEEKQAKQKFELHHMNLIRELNEVNKAVAKALKDLEKERKAKELTEDVCDQLEKECRGDKAELEELKGNTADRREEAGREQKTVPLAGVWKEERGKMKLAKSQSDTEAMNFNLDKLEALLKVKKLFENVIQKKGARVPANVHAHDSPILSQVEKIQIVGNSDANDEAGCCSQVHKWLVDGGEELDSFQLNKEPNARKEGDKQGSRTIVQVSTRTKESNAGKVGDKQGGQPISDSSGMLEQVFNRPDNWATVSNSSPSDKKAVPDSQWIERVIRKSEMWDWKGERASSLEEKESAHSPWQGENTRSHNFLFPGTRRKLGQCELRGHSSSIPKGMAGNRNAIPSDVFGDCMAPTSEPSAHSRLSVSHEQSFTNASSPTHQRSHCLLSPGPTMQDKCLKNSLKEMPWIARVSSLKAKLEVQQNQ